MSSPSRLLLAVLVLTSPSMASADKKPTLPELIVPDSENTPRLQGVIRRFGSTAFRHGGVGPATFSPGEPFFSPIGDTVYVPGNHGLSAFDAATGDVRFHYRYSGLNLTVRNDGEAGIRINFTQGPLAGQFVVLEHGTGRELQRDQQPEINKRPAHAAFAEGQRAIGRKTQQPDPRLGQRSSATAFLYDVTKGSVIAELGKEGRIHRSVLSADHRRLAFLTADMELRVFDTTSGQLLQSLPLGLRESHGERCIPAWSRDGKTVYVWRHHDGEAQIIALDVVSGAIRILVRDDRKGIFSSPAVSPDGSYLAYRLNDNPWKQNSYWRILRLSDLSEAHVMDIRPTKTTAAFSPDSHSFWLLSHCGLARFDLSTGKFDPLSADPLSHTETLAFSRDGTRLYGVAGAQVLTWDVATGREIAPRAGFDDYYRIRAHMRCIHVSADGRRTIWEGPAGDSHVHALVDGRKVGAFYAPNARRHTSFDITADHRHIVHDAYYGELKLGELWTGKTVRELLPKVRPRQTYLIALAPDNRTMALVHRDYQNRSDTDEIEIELWDIQQGRKTGCLWQVGGMNMHMQFSQDSRALRIWHRGKLSVWSVAEEIRLRPETDRRKPPYPIRTTPNRHWFLGYSYRTGGIRKMELVDIHTGEVARTWDHPDGKITAVAFSPNMSLMAVASAGMPAALYGFYEPGPQSAQLERRSDSQLIEALGGDGAVLAFDALCELVRRGDACIPAIRRALTSEPVSPDVIAQLLDQLDSGDFAMRDAATQRLLDAKGRITPILEQALDRGGSLEKRGRLKRILARRRSGDTSTVELTIYRSIEVLAAIRSPAARALLEKLAERDSGLTATHEARAALSGWEADALKGD